MTPITVGIHLPNGLLRVNTEMQRLRNPSGIHATQCLEIACQNHNYRAWQTQRHTRPVVFDQPLTTDPAARVAALEDGHSRTTAVPLAETISMPFFWPITS